MENKRTLLRSGLSCFLSMILIAVPLTGCLGKKDASISQTKRLVVNPTINYADCDPTKEKDSNSSKSTNSRNNSANNRTPENGSKIDIPDEYDSKQQNYGFGGGYECLVDGVRTGIEGWWVCWSTYEGPQGDVARRWVEQGKKYAVGKDLPMIDNRVGVAVKPIYGEVGDYIDVVYKDGNVLHAIILDAQGTENEENAPWGKYGHNGDANAYCNILEWYTDGDSSAGLVYGGTNPCHVSGYEYVTGVVDYIINTNGVNTAGDGNNTTVSDEYCNKENKDDGTVSVNPGEAAAVEASTTARVEWLYGSAGVPETESDNAPYLTTFDVVVRTDGGSKGTWSVTMHKKLETEVKALFQDIYDNTDFVVNPGDSHSVRDWNVEAGKYAAPQTNTNHAYGLALDINATHNYYIDSSGNTVGNSYDPDNDPLAVSSKVVDIFKKHGFFWGGDWTNPKDYMHFAYTDH